MRQLRDMYFGLNRNQQAVVMFLMLIVVSVLAYMIVIKPSVDAYKRKNSNFTIRERETKLLETQLEKLKMLGQLNRPVEAAQIAELNNNGNGILFAAEVPGFLEELKQICEKVGGENFNLIEGETESAFISVGSRNDVYRTNSFPVTIMFESDYSVSSNYLFQLRSMKKLITLGEIDIRSPDLSGRVQVTIDALVYFIEEF